MRLKHTRGSGCDGTNELTPRPLPCAGTGGGEVMARYTQGSSFLATVGLWVAISSRLRKWAWRVGNYAKSARKFGLLRESPRSFTKVRTDQARKSAIVRIVTGKALFLEGGDF